MFTKHIAKELVTAALNDGGTTVHLDSSEYGRYIIGTYALLTVSADTPADTLISILADAIDAKTDTYILKDAETIGSWLDSETGVVYIDVGVTATNLDMAKELGRSYSQIAIFDTATNTEIRL